MTTNAIEVEHLSKRYLLGETHSGTLREAITGRIKRAGERGASDEAKEVWSLRDVTFSMREGEALGVIGRNGAGKSTLLKILSRITEPTGGVSRTRGRVGSLLEVGTGFHPELTGRENVYLNGVILGMSRRDVDRRFDEIVEFSGVARFLDTPIKRYSSGMQLRLAFAVAAHLEPAIMVVDEVLAVGDAEFQRKCIGKMHDVEQAGRTVVFVSHDMDAIARLCSRVIWLERGEVRLDGTANDVIDAYLTEATPGAHRLPPGGVTAGALRVHDVRLVDDAGSKIEVWRRELPFTVEVDYELTDAVPGFDIAISVTTRRGVRVLDEQLSDRVRDGRGRPGRFVARLTVPPVLNSGDYDVGVWFGTAYEDLWWDLSVLRLRLEGTSLRPERAVCLDLPWSVRAYGAGDHDHGNPAASA
jgi:ABC-2 type transport system ATP-binding protein/lipopolysaccharide transport system ATP-binding protein